MPGQDDQGAVKYYPSIKTLGRISEHDVAKELADETTLNPKEAEFVLAQLEKVVLRNIHDGKSVKIGDWATFFVTADTVGAETREECTADNIKSLRVHCRFGEDFRHELNKAEFVNKKKLDRN